MSGLVFLSIRIVLVISLYLFLGWALYTLWLNLVNQSGKSTANQAPLLTLMHTGDMNLQPWSFDCLQVLVGRDPACDCLIEDGTISAQHARLSFHHSQWWVEDLNSTNGTFLNEEPVHNPIVLTSGDRLRIGQVNLKIKLGSD